MASAWIRTTWDTIQTQTGTDAQGNPIMTTYRVPHLPPNANIGYAVAVDNPPYCLIKIASPSAEAVNAVPAALGVAAITLTQLLTLAKTLGATTKWSAANYRLLGE